MRSWTDNIRFPADQSLAALWPLVTGQDPHPLADGVPATKLTAVDRLGLREAAIVPTEIVPRLLNTARNRRPGATYVTHSKTDKLTVVERTA